MRHSKNKVLWLDKGWLPVYIRFCPSENAWHREMKRLSLTEPYQKSDGCTTSFKSGEGKDCIISASMSA